MSTTDPLAALTQGEEPTVEACLRILRRAFTAVAEDAGARVEARAIVGHVLGLDLTGLTSRGTEPVEADALTRIVALAHRRLHGEPIQRVIGAADFFGLSFALSPATLVPRPDTEVLVETVLSRLAAVERPIVADLGVGSGAILVALLHERPEARGVATDVSEKALTTARGNAERHGVADRALFVRASHASALAPGAFDAIVSNPPYIAADVIATLDAEVRLHDPRTALDGGPDGLDAYREIARDARHACRPGGLLALEIGWDQGEAIVDLLRRTGWTEIALAPDLAGRDRVVTARAPRSWQGDDGTAK